MKLVYVWKDYWMERTTATLKRSLILTQGNLALALKIATLASAIIVFYFQDLSIVLVDALNNEATSHILLVPLIFAYLVYRKRKMLRATIDTREKRLDYTTHFGTLGGFLLCATAVMLYWYGSSTFTPLEYHLLTLPLFTAGLTLILFNPQTLRQAIFPIAFLVFLVPPPSEILYGLGAPLSVISATVSNAFVNFLGVHTIVTNDLGNPGIDVIRPDSSVAHFTVAIPCSGIYSLIGFLVFSAFVAYIVRDKLWKKLALFVIGLPFIYFLNIVRITIMLLIGYQWGQQLGEEMFHLVGGWVLIFIGTIILLVTSEKILKTRIFTRKQPPLSCPNCSPKLVGKGQTYCSTCGRLVKYSQASFRKVDIPKILTIIVVTILLFSIQAPVYALTQGPAQILVQTPQGEQGNPEILPEMQGYTLRFVLRDRNFEIISQQNLSLIYEYLPQSQSGQTVWVVFEIADNRWVLHRWEECLVSWPITQGEQVSVTQLDLRDIQILQNPVITARYFAFQSQSDNQTELVLYWFENTVFTVNGTSEQKYVKISLITYPQRPEDVPAAENELSSFAIALANKWEPIKTWTTVAMFLNRNSIILASTSIAFLGAIVIFHFNEKRKGHRANTIAYQKLSKPNQQLLEIIGKESTLTSITSAYQQATSEPTTQEQIQQRIAGLEKTGIVETQIINNQDEPKQIWKTQAF